MEKDEKCIFIKNVFGIQHFRKRVVMYKRDAVTRLTETHWFYSDSSWYYRRWESDTLRKLGWQLLQLQNLPVFMGKIKPSNWRSKFKAKICKANLTNQEIRKIYFLYANKKHAYLSLWFLHGCINFFLLLSCFQMKTSSGSSHSTVYGVFALKRCS